MKGLYKHYKGGLYEIIGEALHTETEETMILYCMLNKPERLFVRPKEVFNGKVTVNGKTVPRFKNV